MTFLTKKQKEKEEIYLIIFHLVNDSDNKSLTCRLLSKNGIIINQKKYFYSAKYLIRNFYRIKKIIEFEKINNQ